MTGGRRNGRARRRSRDRATAPVARVRLASPSRAASRLAAARHRGGIPRGARRGEGVALRWWAPWRLRVFAQGQWVVPKGRRDDSPYLSRATGRVLARESPVFAIPGRPAQPFRVVFP